MYPTHQPTRYPDYEPAPRVAAACYPEAYEGADGIDALRRKSMTFFAPGTVGKK